LRESGVFGGDYYRESVVGLHLDAALLLDLLNIAGVESLDISDVLGSGA
jgi:hypothetical protein